MKWIVQFHKEFEPEFAALPIAAQNELLARARVLPRIGPHLGRPHVDTLAGAQHANMKEMRFHVEGGVWRVAFAFDPIRCAILLAAGDKAGLAQRRLYRHLIARVDDRFARHLASLRPKES